MTGQVSRPMAMSFASLLKGRVAERILTTLLERGGYRVTRLGIEELFDEIKYLSKDDYLHLGLPKALRSLPDLLVADTQVSWAALVEVKYRRRFDLKVARELHSVLSNQRKYWPESYAILMIAEPFVEGGKFHQDYIRLVEPDKTDKLLWTPPAFPGRGESETMEVVWNSLSTIARLFHSSHFDLDTDGGKRRWYDFVAAMDFITGALKELRTL